MKTNSHFVLLASVGLLAIVTATAACGSSSTGTSPTTTPPGLEGGALALTPDQIVNGGSCVKSTGAGTAHAGTISADETWTAANGPHLVTSTVTILATVTIEPCAVVLLSAGAGITVGSASDAGKLIAAGTASVVTENQVEKLDVRPVVFDAAVDSAPWAQILVQPKGSIDLSVTGILDGGKVESNSRGALVVEGVAGGTNTGEPVKSAKVNRVVVDHSSTYGIFLNAWGAFADGSNTVWIRKSGSTDYPYAIRMEPGVAATLPTELFATDNLKNDILLETSKAFTRTDTLVSRGIPYHQKGLLYLNAGVDGSTAKLTIEAGVTLAFEEAAGSGIIIGSSKERPGILEAIGTASAPVVFTSGKETKAAGDWMGLYFHATPTSGSRISYAKIEYAGGDNTSNSFGCGPKDNDSALFVEGFGPEASGPATAFVDNTNFDNIGGTTVIVSGWVSDDGPNLSVSNTFGAATPSCKVSRPRRTGGGDVCDGGRDVCWP